MSKLIKLITTMALIIQSFALGALVVIWVCTFILLIMYPGSCFGILTVALIATFILLITH